MLESRVASGSGYRPNGHLNSNPPPCLTGAWDREERYCYQCVPSPTGLSTKTRSTAVLPVRRIRQRAARDYFRRILESGTEFPRTKELTSVSTSPSEGVCGAIRGPFPGLPAVSDCHLSGCVMKSSRKTTLQEEHFARKPRTAHSSSPQKGMLVVFGDGEGIGCFAMITADCRVCHTADTHFLPSRRHDRILKARCSVASHFARYGEPFTGACRMRPFDYFTFPPGRDLQLLQAPLPRRVRVVTTRLSWLTSVHTPRSGGYHPSPPHRIACLPG